MAISPRDEVDAVENAVDLLIHHLSEPYTGRHSPTSASVPACRDRAPRTWPQWRQDAGRETAGLVVRLELFGTGLFPTAVACWRMEVSNAAGEIIYRLTFNRRIMRWRLRTNLQAVRRCFCE